MAEQAHYLPFFLTDTLYVMPEETILAVDPALSTASVAEPAKPYNEALPSEEAIEKNNLPELHTVGKNLKQIIILAEDDSQPVLSRADGLFLKNILQALKLSFDDVLLLNVHQCTSPAHWEALKQKAGQVIIMFGIQNLPPFAPKNLVAYQVSATESASWLAADSLASVQANVEQKKKLWNSLQQLLVG